MAAFARRVGVLVAIALLAASCGGGDEDDEGLVDTEASTSVVAADTPTPTTEPTAVPETTPTPDQPPPTATPVAIDPEEWVDHVNQLLTDRRYEGTLADVRYSLEQQEKGYSHIKFDAVYWRELAATFTRFAQAMPEPPAEFADLAESHKQASLALAERYLVGADEVDAAVEAEDLKNYEVPEEWDTILALNAEVDEALATACFALRDAVTDSAFGLINCIGGDNFDEIVWRTLEDCLLVQRMFGDQQCGDTESPADDGEATTVEPGESELAAGATYTFDTFARPFALTIDETTRVNVRGSQVVIAPDDFDLWSMFWIVAVDEISDPATFTDNPNESPSVMAMPDDFGGWVESLPFEVASEGQSTFGAITVPYWRLEAPVERDSPDAFEFYHLAAMDLQLARDGMFWLVPHPDGPLIVYTFPWGDEPQGRTGDESTLR